MRRLSLADVLNHADWSMLHVTCFGNIREKNWLEKCFSCPSAQRFNTKLAAALARKISEENAVQEDFSFQFKQRRAKKQDAMAVARATFAMGYMRRRLREARLVGQVVENTISKYFWCCPFAASAQEERALLERQFPELWQARTMQAVRQAVDAKINNILPELHKESRRVLGVPESSEAMPMAEEL